MTPAGRVLELLAVTSSGGAPPPVCYLSFGPGHAGCTVRPHVPHGPPVTLPADMHAHISGALSQSSAAFLVCLLFCVDTCDAKEGPPRIAQSLGVQLDFTLSVHCFTQSSQYAYLRPARLIISLPRLRLSPRGWLHFYFWTKGGTVGVGIGTKA